MHLPVAARVPRQDWWWQCAYTSLSTWRVVCRLAVHPLTLDSLTSLFRSSPLPPPPRGTGQEFVSISDATSTSGPR